MGFGNSPIFFDSREVQTGALQLFYSMDALGKLQYTNYSEIWIYIVQFGRRLHEYVAANVYSMSVRVLQENQSSTDNVSTP